MNTLLEYFKRRKSGLPSPTGPLSTYQFSDGFVFSTSDDEQDSDYEEESEEEESEEELVSEEDDSDDGESNSTDENIVVNGDHPDVIIID